MKILISIIAVVVGFLFYLWNKEWKKKKKELHVKARSCINRLQEANQSFLRLSKGEKGYFSHHLLQNWRNTFNDLYLLIETIPFGRIGLGNDEILDFENFINNYTNGENLRAVSNTAIVDEELRKYSYFFDNVENRKLDIQQRKAIVTDEDNNIIIAGAGSGKTTTIVGKVGYVIDRYKIPPEQILLISFTNKSAATLVSRINIPGVEAKTFHKFGKDVIAETEQRQPSIFDENQFKRIITEFFNELVKNPTYLSKVTSFFTNFLKQEKSQDEFNNQGEYFQYMKDQNFSTYNTQEIPFMGKTTFKREVVKSIEECKIANFLLFNSVKYKYESPYEHETATQKHQQYKPDFTLFSKNGKVYLEHFAINKNGNVPHFFADAETGETTEQATKKYVDGIDWKRELHKKHGTALIETYSHEMYDNVLFEKLSKKLEAAGVKLIPKSSEEIWEIISKAARDEVDSFISLFQTFIMLMKSNNYSLDDVRNRNTQVQNMFFHQRNSLFIEIIAPLYEKYQNYLSERKEIDFSDMINLATEYIASGKYQRKYSYVIIDEFQDISIGRYQLVRAIKETNPYCKLFCVGDDWQSIYRFSGSDIALFKDFEKYFGFTEKAKIETTYRFHDPLINLSSDFILKNPNQTQKALRGLGNHKSSTYYISYSNSNNQDDTLAVQDIFNELLLSGKATGKEIFVLGRYSFDIDRLKNEDRIFHIDKKSGIITYSYNRAEGEALRLTAQFMTIHKSKGLEADIIIVINCNSGKHGFPSGITDDPVLNLLLSESDQFENGEERRLFYVAMTRAKEMVYFVADSSYKSKFISELEVEDVNSDIKKCPKCINADLVKRTGVKNGRSWAFYGCSNFMYGCNYRKWVN